MIQRRSEIEERIDRLEAENKVEAIKDQIFGTGDPEIKSQLEKELNDAQVELRELKSEATILAQKREAHEAGFGPKRSASRSLRVARKFGSLG